MAGLPGLPPPGFSQAAASPSGLPGLPPPGFSSMSEESSSGTDITLGAMKGIGQGALSIFTAPADLLYKGGMEAVNALTGNDTELQGGYPSQRVEQLYDWVSGNQGNETAEAVGELGANLATVIAVPSQAPKIAAKIPLLSKIAKSGGTGSTLANLLTKAIGYGTEGAGYSVLGNSTADNPLENAGEGAALNIAIPTALKVTGSLAKGLLNSTTEAGRKLELSAFGAGKGRIKDAINRMPDILDDSGRFENPINDALVSFQKSGGASKSMDGRVLFGELETQYDDLVGKLRQELEPAQTLQKDVIVPTFAKTDEYIANLAGTNKAKAAEIAKEEIANTVNNTDGTLLSLQDEKVKLGQAIRDSAWGTDAAGQLKVNILKRIRADLREEVEKSYSILTGKPASTIKDLNKELGRRESLFPLFKDMISSGESRNILGSGIQSLRTSGGVGQTAGALIAGQVTGGPLLAAGAVGANMFLQSPAGKRALSNGLRSSAVQSPLKIAEHLSISGQPIGRLASSQAGENETQSRQPSSPLSQLLANTTKQKAGSKSEASPSLLERTTGQNPKQSLLSTVLGKPGEDMTKIDKFISKEEGGQRLDAYPPPAEGSGVTVATGVDLGQRTKEELKNLGLSEGVLKKVEPYLGKKDAYARTVLKGRPLSLTKDEADELDSAIQQDIFGTVEDKLKDQGVDFSSLPTEAQTVVKSLAWNFGKNIDQKLPTIWGAILDKDWSEVQKLLVNTKWKQPELKDRRVREASLLKKLIV